MSELSPDTEHLIHSLFKPREAEEIGDILEIECGTESLKCDGWTPVQMERIRFAVLKLAIDSEIGLDQALGLARKDWRDLLMSAGFGQTLDAHEKWYKSVTN